MIHKHTPQPGRLLRLIGCHWVPSHQPQSTGEQQRPLCWLLKQLTKMWGWIIWFSPWYGQMCFASCSKTGLFCMGLFCCLTAVYMVSGVHTSFQAPGTHMSPCKIQRAKSYPLLLLFCTVLPNGKGFLGGKGPLIYPSLSYLCLSEALPSSPSLASGGQLGKGAMTLWPSIPAVPGCSRQAGLGALRPF